MFDILYSIYYILSTVCKDIIYVLLFFYFVQLNITLFRNTKCYLFYFVKIKYVSIHSTVQLL